MTLSRLVHPVVDVGSGIKPSDGAQLFFTNSNTLADEDTFNAPDGLTPNANPVIADANGVFPDIYLSPVDYKIVLKDKNNVQKGEFDPVNSFIKTSETSFDFSGTLAEAKSSLDVVFNAVNPQTWRITDRADGLFDVVSGATANTWNIVDHDTLPLQFQLRKISPLNTAMFGTVGDGVTDDTPPIVAALSTLVGSDFPTDQNNKIGGTVYFPTPSAFYRIESSIDLTEIWSLTLNAETSISTNRATVANDVDQEGGLFRWFGNATDSMFKIVSGGGNGDSSQNVNFRNISVNGRNILKAAFDLGGTTVLNTIIKEILFDKVTIKRCDFGVLVGNTTAQTDVGSVDFYSCVITHNKSMGILWASGNGFGYYHGGNLTSNGFAPSTGNSFIADAANRGTQVKVVGGYFGLTTTIDSRYDVITPANDTRALYANIDHTGGGLRIDNVWDDSRGVISLRTLGTGKNLHVKGLTHFDGSMTKADTPTSIMTTARQPLVLIDCTVFGDIDIGSGNQASVIASGVTFVDPLSGYTGTAIPLGGLAETAASGFNETVQSIGGPIPTDQNIPPSFTSYSRPGGANRSMRARGTTGQVNENVDASGNYELLENAYFDTLSSQYKSTRIGPCLRRAFSNNGLDTLETFTAVSIDQVITFVTRYRVVPLATPNGVFAIETAGGRQMFWENTFPAAGTFSIGSIVFNRNPAIGSPTFWQCTVSGTPGTWVAGPTL